MLIHGLPVYRLNYLTPKVDTHEVDWYVAQRDAIKKRVAVPKTTSPQLTKQYQE